MSEAPAFAGYALPANSNVPWEGKKKVRHLVYKLRQATDASEFKDNLPDKSVRLFKQEETPPVAPLAASAADVEPIAKELIGAGGDYSKDGASDIDIDLTEQCWIVIELDRKTNWRFSRTHPALTTKVPETQWPADDKGWYGFNTDLRYVFDNGHISDKPDGAPEDVDCHMVFFRVTRRVKGFGCAMNYFVELYRARRDGKATGLVPIIIDPQVPDDPPSIP